MRTTAWAGGALCVASIMAAAPAAAQTASSSAANSPALADGEIVVTAQRREERLIDVPIAVSAINAATLDRAGVTTVNNIGTVIPNIQINQTVGNTFGPLISIRGLAPSADTSLARDQPVGLYLDGVPIAKSTGAAFETVDLQRVEVLRGPQGTLYGKNTIGGAVNLITQEPTGEFGGSLLLGGGEWNRSYARGTVDLPAVGAFKLRVGFSARNNGGYFRNRTTGKGFGAESVAAGRVDLMFQPSAAFSARYVFDITDSDGTPSMLAISAPGSVAANSPFIAGQIYPTRPGRDDIGANSAPFSDYKTSGHALTLSYDLGDAGMLGDVAVKSITARRTLFTNSASDFDGTPTDLLRFILRNRYRAFSQELQLIGTGEAIRYTLGGFYLKDSYDVFNPRWNFQFGGNRFDLSERGGGSRSLAGYGQLTWTPGFLDRKLDVSVGARYTRERKRARELFLSNATYLANPRSATSGVFQRAADGTPITRSGQPAAGARPGAGGIGPSDLIPLEAQKTFQQFNPELNMVYKLQPDWTVYGRVATGFKSGGINDTAATNAAFNTPYDPEKLLSFELGTKLSAFDRRFNLNVALYHSIYKDFQAGVFVPELVTTNIINAGEAKFSGIEIEGSIRPVDSLSINYGFGYIDARYTDFVLPNGTDVTSIYTIPLVPKYNYLVGAVHRLPLGGATLETSVNYSWRSSQFATITADPLSRRKAYGLLDARIAVTGIAVGGGTELEVAIYARNLADEKYWVSGINLAVLTVRQWGDPRSFGAEARIRF